MKKTDKQKKICCSSLTEKTNQCNALLLIGLLAPSQQFHFQLLAKQR
jgi:hypothetical protein